MPPKGRSKGRPRKRPTELAKDTAAATALFEYEGDIPYDPSRAIEPPEPPRKTIGRPITLAGRPTTLAGRPDNPLYEWDIPAKIEPPTRPKRPKPKPPVPPRKIRQEILIREPSRVGSKLSRGGKLIIGNIETATEAGAVELRRVLRKSISKLGHAEKRFLNAVNYFRKKKRPYKRTTGYDFIGSEEMTAKELRSSKIIARSSIGIGVLVALLVAGGVAGVVALVDHENRKKKKHTK